MRKEIQWFQNAIIYQIFIDRFSGTKHNYTTNPRFNGGNIKGIIEKFDYFTDLGINTLWLSPFYKTTAYHGYHITDFYEIDPQFGNSNDLKTLINICHQSNIKIIIDFVPNHCSEKHYFFQQALNNNPKYKDWFLRDINTGDYLYFLGYREIPKLNLSNYPTTRHIIDSAKKWLDMGIDGFRIDHAIGPSMIFYNQFCNEINTQYPHAILIGEIWVDGISKQFYNTINPPKQEVFLKQGVSQFQAQHSYYNILDGVLDFSYRNILINHFIKKQNIEENHLLKASLKRHYNKYPKDYFLVGFLDNHDTDRMRYLAYSDQQYRNIVKSLFSIDQPIVIYYGDETGMTQKTSVKSGKPYADIAARQNMNWDSIDSNLLTLYKELIKHKLNK